MDSGEYLPARAARADRRARPSGTARAARRMRRTNPFGDPAQRGRAGRPRRASGSDSAAAAVLALVAKFFAAIKALFLLLPNLKLLTTAGTALVSVAAYSLFWGWEFAVGFVILLFVHEMGHVIQLRREGIQCERTRCSSRSWAR